MDQKEIKVSAKDGKYWNADDHSWHPLSELKDDGWVQHGGVMPSNQYVDEYVIWFVRDVRSD